MNTAFKKALELYKYLSIPGSILFWIFLVINDLSLIKQYWATHWPDYLWIWARYYLAYFLVLSVYYWVIASIVILIYHRWIKRGEANS